MFIEKKFIILVALSVMSVCNASAQGWGDLLKGVIGGDAANVVNSLLGTGFSTQRVVGTWEYAEPAVSLRLALAGRWYGCFEHPCR